MNPTEPNKRKRRGKQAVVGGTARLTAPQTPAEGRNHNSGVIRPNTGMLSLPRGLTEPERRSFLRPGLVMLIIGVLALIFIIIIAWFIAHEPPKEKSSALRETSSEMRK